MGPVRALAVALAAAVACAAPPPPVPPGLVFPRHTLGAGDAMPEALLEGVLREERGCLWLEAETGDVIARQLALWPPDWGARLLEDGRVAVIDGSGTVVAEEDAALQAAGGETASGVRAVTAATEAEAGKCSGGPWWLVTEVVPAP